MILPFHPRTDILPTAQAALWPVLRAVPAEFSLYGGTGIALHLGHRESVDFNFLSNRDIQPEALLRTLPFLAGAQVSQLAPNTLDAVVDRSGPVKVSFFGLPHLARLRPPLACEGNGLRVASLLDLAGTKAAVVQQRSELKDYVDVDAILAKGHVSLITALAAGQAIYGSQFNAQVSLKALAYFGDGNLASLPPDARQATGDGAVRPIPATAEMTEIARRLMWFEDPATALADPVRFMAYAMARATHEDMARLRVHVSKEDFLEALERAPPGIIDPRSWWYWNLVVAGRSPPPPMPSRRIP